MTICIQREGLTLPVSALFALYVADLLAPYKNEKALTFNFRDPSYSVDDGGYHPVEVRLEKEGKHWQLVYITDFCYVGTGNMAELAKDLDFDFQAGVFQNLHGVYPIEQAVEMYQLWEQNFIYYATTSKVFEITVSIDT